MLLFQKYTLFGSFSIKCILFHQIWPPYFLRYDQFTYTSENRNLGTFQHFSSNPGSGVEFVAISLLWNHPWFYCSWHQGHQKKSGCLFQNPITFSIEGVFQNGRLYGYKNIRMSELCHIAYQIVPEIIRNKNVNRTIFVRYFVREI